MSAFDAIYAALDAARTVTQTAEAASNAEFDAWQQTVTGIKSAAAAQAAADAATITDLRRQIAALTPATLWGCNLPPKLLAAKNKAFGGIDIARVFQGAGVTPHWPTPAELGAPLGPTALILSGQAPLADIAAGKYDDAYRALFAATPTDRPTFICLRHEPELKENPADYTAAWQRIAPLARAAGPHIKLTIILMGWTANPKSGRNWRDWYPGDDVVDVLAWDPYRWTPADPADATTMYDLCRTAAQTAGKPWAIAETGVDVNTHTPQQRAAALQGMAKALAAASPPPVFVCYFDNVQGPHRWTVSDDPAAMAAWKAGRTA